MRHLDVKLLWLQEGVQRGRFKVGKVGGATNVADALTKYHDRHKLQDLCDPHGMICGGPDGESTVGPRGGVNSEHPPECEFQPCGQR